MASGSGADVLIGRSNELGLVRRALDDASLHGVLVSGESGVGKSTLVAAAADDLEAAGASVLAGHCSPGALQLPYLPFVEALRAGDAGACSPFEGVHDNERWTGWNTIRLWESVQACLRDRAATRRTVLIIEDLHWADESTRSLLDFLIRSRRIEGLSIVLTYREDELPLRDPVRGYVSELVATRRLASLVLGPLDRPSTRELAGRLMNGERPTGHRVDEVVERSDGNPMFVTELVAAGVDRQSLGMPRTLLDALARRLARLTADGLTVAQHAALSVLPVDDTLLARALGWPEDRAATGIRDAVGQHVLVPAASGTGVVVRHALLREALLLELLPGERRRIHRALADAIHERSLPGAPSGETSAALAYHWDAAGSAAEALEWSIVAAIDAANANGFAEATRLFDQALGWWDDVPATEHVRGRTRLDVLELAAESSELAGDRRRAQQWLDQALPLAEGEPVGRRSVLLTRLSSLHRESGDVVRARAMLDRAMALGPAVGGPEWTHMKVAEAALLFILSDHDTAAVVSAEARAAARARGAAAEEAEALFVVAVTTAFAGDIEGGLTLAADLIRVADAAGYAPGVAGGHFTDGFVRQAALRFDEAAAAFDRGAQVATDYQLDGWLGKELVAEAAEARRRSGDWAAARRQLDARLAAYEGPNTEVRVVRALLAVGMGDLEVAAADLEIIARRLREPLPWVDQSGKYFVALAELELLRGRPEAALDAAREGIGRIALSRDVRWLGGLAWAAVRAVRGLGVGREALDELLVPYREAAAIARERRNIFALEVDAHDATIEAERALLDGRADPHAWLAVRDHWARTGQPFPTAHAALRAAEALFAARRRRDGRRLLAEAHAIATRLGARPLLEETRRLDAGLGSPDAAPAGPAELHRAAASYGLTARETQLLAMLAEAPSDDDIAEELVISPKTASVHISNLKAKVGVATRAELVRLAVQLRNGR